LRPFFFFESFFFFRLFFVFFDLRRIVFFGLDLHFFCFFFPFLPFLPRGDAEESNNSAREAGAECLRRRHGERVRRPPGLADLPLNASMDLIAGTNREVPELCRLSSLFLLGDADLRLNASMDLIAGTNREVPKLCRLSSLFWLGDADRRGKCKAFLSLSIVSGLFERFLSEFADRGGKWKTFLSLSVASGLFERFLSELADRGGKCKTFLSLSAVSGLFERFLSSAESSDLDRKRGTFLGLSERCEPAPDSS